MREAVFTVSPNRQYLGIACPTTPVRIIHTSYNVAPWEKSLWLPRQRAYIVCCLSQTYAALSLLYATRTSL